MVLHVIAVIVPLLMGNSGGITGNIPIFGKVFIEISRICKITSPFIEVLGKENPLSKIFQILDNSCSIILDTGSLQGRVILSIDVIKKISPNLDQIPNKKQCGKC